MKKFAWLPLFLLLACGRLDAAQPIASLQDLVDNSRDTGTGYILNSGDYVINSSTTLSISGKDFAIDKADTTLTLDNGAGTTTMFTVRNFTLDLGTLTATGGTTSLDYGFNATKVIVNSGLLTGYGGSAANSDGIRVGSGGLTVTGGTVAGHGGTAGIRQSYGIRVSGAFSQSGGTVTAFGGNAPQNYGLYLDGASAMSAGTLNATGGGNNASGVMAYGGFTLTGGTINATGGSDFMGHGISSQYSPFIQNGGAINAVGGTNADTGGIYATQFTQNAGTINAKGGDNGPGKGIYIGNNSTFTQNGGTTIATGGAAANGVGLYAGNLVQRDGAMTGIGGAGAYGIFVIQTLNQTGGVMTARGSGTFADGYGITLYNNASANINGELRLEREAAAASLFLRDRAILTLGAGSTLVPVVDLAKVAVNDANASGLIASDNGDVVIAGAAVTPYFVGTRLLAVGAAGTLDLPFISLANGGTIQGDFLQQRGGYFFEYEIVKISDTGYALRVEHNTDVEDATPFLTCENSRRLIEIMDADTRSNPGVSPFGEMWDFLENSQSEDDWRRRAAHVGRTLAPLAYTKLTQTFVRLADLVQRGFSAQLAHAAARAEEASVAGAALASLAPADRWHFWANPLYQQSSRFRAYCYEFDDAKERFWGLQAGLARDFGQLTVGGALHYVDARYDAAYSDIDADNFGATLGARLRGLVPGGDWFDPRLEATLGYTHSRIRQRLRGYEHGMKRSDPDADVFRASFAVANPLRPTSRLSLVPSLGVDYTVVRQGGYAEKGDSAYLLDVSRGTYHSLKPKIGLEAVFEAGGGLSLFVNGFWRYEAGDRNSSFRSEVVSHPAYAITARGERLHRVSYTLGAGLRRRVNDRVSLSAGYDLLAADNYRAHSFTAAFSLAF